MARKKSEPTESEPKETAAPAKVGRPTLLTPELADEICDRVASGETLPNICVDERIPHERTIRRWAREDGPFREAYARAREEQMHSWADEIVTISDDGSRDYVVTEENGRKVTKVDHDHIQRSKLRVDTRKFLMAKIAPKTFGEKVNVDVRTGPIDEMNDEQLDQHIARIAADLGVSLARPSDGAGGEEAQAESQPAGRLRPVH